MTNAEVEQWMDDVRTVCEERVPQLVGGMPPYFRDARPTLSLLYGRRRIFVGDWDGPMEIHPYSRSSGYTLLPDIDVHRTADLCRDILGAPRTPDSAPASDGAPPHAPGPQIVHVTDGEAVVLAENERPPTLPMDVDISVAYDIGGRVWELAEPRTFQTWASKAWWSDRLWPTRWEPTEQQVPLPLLRDIVAHFLDVQSRQVGYPLRPPSGTRIETVRDAARIVLEIT